MGGTSTRNSAAIEGGAQFAFQLQAVNGAIVHGGIKEFGTSGTKCLGAAQGGLGVPQRIVRA